MFRIKYHAKYNMYRENVNKVLCRNTNDNPGRTTSVDYMRILKCFSVGVWGEGGVGGGGYFYFFVCMLGWSIPIFGNLNT